MKNTQNKIKKDFGFTLVEILVAISVLVIVITMGTGGLVQVIGAHRQTQALQRTMNDLNFTLESISRHVRFGTNYTCVGTGADVGSRCLNDGLGNQKRLLVDFEGDPISYRLLIEDGIGEIQRCGATGNDCVSITSRENVDVDILDFYVAGAEYTDDKIHPRMTVVVSGKVIIKGEEAAPFSIQTTVDQRANEKIN